MLFIELNAKVLLDIYAYLDPVDAVNLAQTCVTLRDVAQLHFKRYRTFNLPYFLCDPNRAKRLRNRDAATTVLKHIGAFISVLVTDLHENRIGPDLGESIRKYCVNVKSLNLNNGLQISSLYTEWLNNLKLDRISFAVDDLLPMHLAEITGLKELVFYTNPLNIRVDKKVWWPALKRIIERNCSITSLRMRITTNFEDYEVFRKLTSLKCLDTFTNREELKLIADNFRMTDLDRFMIEFYNINDMDTEGENELNIFLRNVAEKAPKLNDLSVQLHGDEMVEYPPVSLDSFKLTSLRLAICSSYIWLPKTQPHLKHLDLVFYDVDGLTNDAGASWGSTRRIVLLIRNLQKLEVLHVRADSEFNLSKTVRNFRNELVIRKILGACAINRPTLRLYLANRDDRPWKFLRATVSS